MHNVWGRAFGDSQSNNVSTWAGIYARQGAGHVVLGNGCVVVGEGGHISMLSLGSSLCRMTVAHVEERVRVMEPEGEKGPL